MSFGFTYTRASFVEYLPSSYVWAGDTIDNTIDSKAVRTTIAVRRIWPLFTQIKKADVYAGGRLGYTWWEYQNNGPQKFVEVGNKEAPVAIQAVMGIR